MMRVNGKCKIRTQTYFLFTLHKHKIERERKSESGRNEKVLTGLKVQMLGGVGWNIIMRS